MRGGATVRSLGVDQLELIRPARAAPLVFPAVLTAAFACGAWFSTGNVALTVVLMGLVAVPVVMARALRAAVARRHVLVRAPGRLLLDGEPLEAARVELRVTRHWLLRRPQHYCLSLWALIGRGEQLDVELGQFSNVLDASALSGQMEEFLDRARQRAPGRAHTGD